jgi:hypothetical protein
VLHAVLSYTVKKAVSNLIGSSETTGDIARNCRNVAGVSRYALFLMLNCLCTTAGKLWSLKSKNERFARKVVVHDVHKRKEDIIKTATAQNIAIPVIELDYEVAIPVHVNISSIASCLPRGYAGDEYVRREWDDRTKAARTIKGKVALVHSYIPAGESHILLIDLVSLGDDNVDLFSLLTRGSE